MFKKYISRSEAWHNEYDVIYTFFVGSVFGTVTCLAIAVTMYYHYRKRLHADQGIYLPLSLFFFLISLIKLMEIVSIWRSYAWIIALLNMLWGIVACWVMWEIPAAIIRRIEISLCSDLRKEREEMRQIMDELKQFRKSLSDKGGGNAA